MNQNPSHSQTPEFGHIPSTGILRQQPPSSEQIARANKSNKFKAVMQDVIAVAILISPILSTPFVVKSCSEDVDRQAVQAVKFQAEANHERSN